MGEIWIERYRPKNFAEVIGQDNIVDTIRSFVEKKNLPHMLFAGPAGVGKSSLALVISKQLYGDTWRQNFLELNASDDRGIDVIRQTIKDFAKTKPLGEIPFKVIFLDECDNLTRDAQQALRRTMENFSKSTRFCLSCNYSSKLIDPIVSRCAVFRFQSLQKKDVVNILEGIGKKEGLDIKDETLHLIADLSEGDVRRAENILQSCASLSNKVTNDSVKKVARPLQYIKVKELLTDASNGDFIKAKEKTLELMLYDGFSAIDIIKSVHRAVWELEISDKDKLEIIEKTAEIEFRVVEGSDEFIQMEALLASIARK